MNIFTLIILITLIAIGYFSGELLARYFGVYGWLWGSFLGFTIPGLLYSLVIGYINKHFPLHPKCSTGECTSKDYKIVEYDEGNGTCVFLCKCGNKYVFNYPYFRKLLSDDSTQPYMKKNKATGKWVKEEERELKEKGN